MSKNYLEKQIGALGVELPEGISFGAANAQELSAKFAMTPNQIGTLNQEPVLTDFALRHRPVGFIMPDIVPNVAVSAPGDSFKYRKWEKSNAFRKYDTYRAPGSEAKRMVIKGELATSAVVEKALSYALATREIDALQIPNLGAQNVEMILDILDLLNEVEVANCFQNTSAITHAGGATSAAITNTTDLTAAKWTAYDSTDEDTVDGLIYTAIDAIRSSMGVDPNTIILPPAIARIVASVKKARFQYIAGINEQAAINSVYGLPSKLWGLDIKIPTGVYNSSPVEGTFTTSNIWGGTSITLAYIDKATNPSPNRISAVYNFYSRWRRVRQFMLPEAQEGQVWEVSDIHTINRVAPEALYVYTNVL